jgi:alkaline phosphatase
MKFVKKNPGTVVISTSDHETGGLTVGRQVTETYPEYVWKPEIIAQVKNSSEILSWMWAKAIEDGKDTEAFLLDTIIEKGLGINDTRQDEFNRLWAWKESGTTTNFFATALSDLVSKRAQIGVSKKIYGRERDY